MAEKLVSVIVPVFNAEKYVNRCIDSILNQTYENLEVILVNDGSVDGSIKICEKWQKLDSRVKLITQENAGVSAARNTGIENATGDYISFVDNDDWLRPEMYKNLVRQAQKDNADLTFCKFINVDKSYNRENINEINLSPENLKHPEFFFLKNRKGNNLSGIIGCCNRILIKKEMLKKLKFDTSLKFGENVLFVLNLVKNAKRISVVDEYLYNHFKDSDIKTYDENYIEHLNAYHKAVSKFFKTNNLELGYLLDNDYVHKVIKAYIKNDNFVSAMKDAEESNEIFKTALSKANYKKLKKLKHTAKLKFKNYLIFHKKWNCYKKFFK